MKKLLYILLFLPMIGFGQNWTNDYREILNDADINTDDTRLFSLKNIDTITIINYQKDIEIINEKLGDRCIEEACYFRCLYWHEIWKVRYYDDLLNYYYNIMKHTLPSSNFEHFQNSQISWISSRDEYWKCIDEGSDGWAYWKVTPILSLYQNRIDEMLTIYFLPN